MISQGVINLLELFSSYYFDQPLGIYVSYLSYHTNFLLARVKLLPPVIFMFAVECLIQSTPI